MCTQKKLFVHAHLYTSFEKCTQFYVKHTHDFISPKIYLTKHWFFVNTIIHPHICDDDDTLDTLATRQYKDGRRAKKIFYNLLDNDNIPMADKPTGFVHKGCHAEGLSRLA